MPYIKQEDRKKFDPHIDALVQKLDPTSPGEFNYIVSKLLWMVWHKKPGYTLGNNLIGMLDCVKMEFYRRFLAPYEDTKIEENGDLDY
jgi:hypothetical protein